jgi:flagellar protein FliL
MNLYIKSTLIIALITLIGVGGILAWEKMNVYSEAKTNETLSVDDLLKQSVDTGQIMTNCSDGGFIKAQFKLIATSPKKAEDLQKLSFKVQNTIIQTLNGMTSQDFNGPKGFDLVEGLLKKRLNQELGDNDIERVYTTEKTVQSPS